VPPHDAQVIYDTWVGDDRAKAEVERDHDLRYRMKQGRGRHGAPADRGRLSDRRHRLLDAYDNYSGRRDDCIDAKISPGLMPLPRVPALLAWGRVVRLGKSRRRA
jgi:hypothetical protein